MAKLAQCGYGSRGQGVGKNPEGYTYVVNDNVRVGQKLQVISTARNHTTKFVTTAVPLTTYNENSVLGKTKKAELGGLADKLTKAYTGGELGSSGETRKKDVTIGQNEPQSEYTITTRALAAKKFQETDPNVEFSKNTQKTIKYYNENKPVPTGSGTFADYSKQFMKEGEKL